jgi:Arc/MetJ family transcription regulator
MKTTIDIPDEVLEEAMRLSGSSTKREAVLKALEEYNRRRRLAKVAEKLGTLDFIDREELGRLRTGRERTWREAR